MHYEVSQCWQRNVCGGLCCYFSTIIPRLTRLAHHLVGVGVMGHFGAVGVTGIRSQRYPENTDILTICLVGDQRVRDIVCNLT